MGRSAGWIDRTTRTRRNIAAVALDLFARRGFDAVTVADIAAHAEVGERTVYRYYPSKIDIVLTDQPGELGAFVGALHDAPTALSLTDAVAHVIAASAPDDEVVVQDRIRIDLIRRHPALRQAWLAELDAIEPGIAEWIAERTGRGPADPEVRVAAAALVAAHRVVVDAWDGDTYESYLDFVRRALATVSAGLGAMEQRPRGRTRPSPGRSSQPG